MPEPTTLPDNPTSEQLEAATNETMADVLDSPQSRASAGSIELAKPEAPASSEPGGTPATPAPSPQGGQVDFTDDEKAFLAELRTIKEVSGTPFKSVPDLVKAHKELQSTYTREHEFLTQGKPIEHLVRKAIENPAYRQFLEEVTPMFDNPQLAAAYAGQAPGQADVPPDPRAYDMYDPESYAKFQQEQAAYLQRKVDGTLNARLSQSESRQRLEMEKQQLKAAFPDANPDEIVTRLQERSKKGWSITDGYKVLEFDNIASKALEQARKEVAKQLETAKATGTPAAGGGAREEVKLADIIDHINRYGGDSARKKFGDRNFSEALHATAEMQLS